MPGKRVQFDDETWAALDLFGRDRMATFQELADEAFADLLKKHQRPVGLKAALRKSAGASAEVVSLSAKKATKKKTKRKAGRKNGG
jgi:hypothetical protein